MKYLILAVAALLSFPYSAAAQGDWTEEQWREDMYAVPNRSSEEKMVSASADSKTGIIEMAVPQKLGIADKVIVENASSYMIEQMAIVVDYKGDGKFVPLASTSKVFVGEAREILDSDGNIRSLRGRTLKIKVKGVDSTAGSTTYDFNVTLYEKNMTYI